MIAFIYSPFPSLKSAKKAANILVKSKIIACANIVKSSSVYEWKGAVENEVEYLLIAKTSMRKKSKAIKKIKELHPYDLPAVIMLKADCNKKYENWVKEIVNA